MDTKELFMWLLSFISSFLIGSIMFSEIIPDIFLKKDISEIGADHNPGAANVFINCGIFWGMICLFLDLAKGFIPVFFVKNMLGTDNILFAFILTAPVLGHAVAPLNHFKGGKCISTAFGSLLALCPQSFVVFILAIIYILLSTVLKLNPVRLRSIITFTLFGTISLIVLIIKKKFAIALGCIFISLTAIIKHLKVYEEKEPVTEKNPL